SRRCNLPFASNNAARIFRQPHQLVVCTFVRPVRRGILQQRRPPHFVPDFPVFYVRVALCVRRIVHSQGNRRHPVSPDLVGSRSIRIQVNRRLTCSVENRSQRKVSAVGIVLLLGCDCPRR